MRVLIISLGCSKNLVDSEILGGLLLKENFVFVKNLQDAEVLILNTCAFIGPARKEAKSYINRLIKRKSFYGFRFVVMGCLPQVEKELLKKYPEIDAVFGVGEFHKIPQYLKKLSAEKITEVSQNPQFLADASLPRAVSTPQSYSYLKIADGCDNRCAYCLIPTIRGAYRERRIEDIVKEAERLVLAGTRELILISHDTTFYGIRIYKKQMLHKLISELSEIKDLFRIRILYTHPARFYDRLIDEIAQNEKVCKYIDVPIQHTSDKILSLMRRPTTRKRIFELVEKLRKKIRNITLRTTVMVGFPSESEKDFKTLYRDIKNLAFDWLGCFDFSLQKGTPAQKIEPKVPAEIKKRRFREVMLLQQKITYEKNKKRIGKIYSVLVDGENYGHGEFQCPEVDGKTYFLEQPQKIIERVKIEKVKDVYDLSGGIL